VSVFVVRHQHRPESCPAADFTFGARLLNLLSRTNAARHGVRIHGEAVLQGTHTLLVIAESNSEEDLLGFLSPLAQAGTLEVERAASCARVVANGGCAAATPTLDPLVTPLDPEEACQDALDAGLVVHRAHPLNAETSLHALIGGVVMPNARFYVRNHFQIPNLDASSWRLDVSGLVERPLSISLGQLQAMPSASAVVTLECAGNGRAGLDPPVPGEPWGLGAVSTAEWTGVALTEVLDRAGLKPDAMEVVFEGADSGTVEGCLGPIHFERSLPVDQLYDAGAILAYAMNGEALPVHHGYPLRLIVPGWYAVASVKWLRGIRVIGSPFDGYYQDEKYQYEKVTDGKVDRQPVTLQQVRSLIIEPRPDQKLAPGEAVIRGVAWSGAAPIARVEVSMDDGPWQPATLVGERQRGRWQWWQLAAQFDQPGTVSIRARATDLAGRTQPESQQWNVQGYGNNAIQHTRVTVGAG
jgi:DMSO/TMAO reductase YedYZ molybdopterin-dependent catalytic subunit